MNSHTHTLTHRHTLTKKHTHTHRDLQIPSGETEHNLKDRLYVRMNRETHRLTSDAMFVYTIMFTVFVKQFVHYTPETSSAVKSKLTKVSTTVRDTFFKAMIGA